METSSDDGQRIYERLREEILERQLSNSIMSDKAVLTLASGGLVVSLTLVADVAPAGGPVSFWLLYVSWSALTLSIISVLSSFAIGQRALETRLDDAYQYYCLKKPEYLNRQSRPGRIISTLNKVSPLLFVIGLFGIVGFGAINLRREAIFMEKQGKEKMLLEDLRGAADVPRMRAIPTDTEKAAPVPSMQELPKPQQDQSGEKPQASEPSPVKPSTSQGDSQGE